MYERIADVTILIAYISIIVEIIFFSVPSIASSRGLFTLDKRKIGTSGLLDKVRKLSWTKKFIVIWLPDVLSMIIFLIPLALIFTPGVFMYLLPMSSLTSTYFPLIGIICLIAGRGISLRAVPVIKGKDGTIHTDVSLITKGIFAWSRNPIALGMILTYLGVFLIAPSFIIFIGFLIYTANMHFRILLEEDFMRGRHGHAYEEYMRNVRRYI